MSPFLALLRVQWLTRTGALRTRKAGRLGTAALALMGQGVLFFLLLSTAWVLYQHLSPSGQAGLLPGFGVLLGFLVILLFNGLAFFSSFFDNHDADLLLSLPLPPAQILAAKSLAHLPSSYTNLLAAAGPFWLVYGLYQGTPTYWVMLLPVVLLLPLLPLSLVASVVLLVGYATAGRVRTDWLRAGIGVLLFGGLMVVQALSARHQVGGSPYAGAILSQQKALQGLVSALWPVQTAARAILAPTLPAALLAWALLLLQTAVAVGLLALLGRLTFLRAWSGDVGGRTSRSPAAAPAAEAGVSSPRNGEMTVRSPMRALWWREWALVLRTPTLLTQILMFNLLMPLAIFLPILLGPRHVLHHPSPHMQSWIVFGLLTYLLFLGSLNLLAISSVSREGRWFWISQTLPVSPGLQVRVKTAVAVLGGVAALLVLTSLGVFGLYLDPLHAGLFLLLGLAATLLTSLLGILSDLTSPRLHWTDPQQALRGGGRAVQNLVLSFGSLLAMGAVAAACAALHLPVQAVLWVLLLALGATDWQMLRVVDRYGVLRYRQIEM